MAAATDVGNSDLQPKCQLPLVFADPHCEIAFSSVQICAHETLWLVALPPDPTLSYIPSCWRRQTSRCEGTTAFSDGYMAVSLLGGV